jgi:hypothetical protein
MRYRVIQGVLTVITALVVGLSGVATASETQKSNQCQQMQFASAMLLKQRHEGASKEKLLDSLADQSPKTSKGDSRRAFIKAMIEDAYAQPVPNSSEARRKAQNAFGERWYKRCQSEL